VRVNAQEEPRSRAITTEEYERILTKVKQVRPHDHAAWERFLSGLWESGFRLGELMRLSWDADAPITFDHAGQYPKIRFGHRSHKSKKARCLPITRRFWELCCQTPVAERSGPVFLIPNRHGDQLSIKRVARIIGKMGRQAGVVVDRRHRLVRERIEIDGRKTDQFRLVERDVVKYASAHDFRRGFLTRMERLLSRGELHKWSGHSKLSTVMNYYYHVDLDELSAKVWDGERPADS